MEPEDWEIIAVYSVIVVGVVCVIGSMTVAAIKYLLF